MAQLNGLPVYSINFKEDPSEDSGIDFVSLVDYPAIESNWVAMSKENTRSPLKFGFDSDKQIIYGPILIPNKPIYRYNEQTGEEYYVVFPKEVVERLIRKFQLQAKTINLNYQHQKDSQIKQAVIQEIWLTGKLDKSQTLGFELEEGSGFVGAFIGDKKFWDEEIKTGNVKGFSIEGFLDLEMKRMGKAAKFDVIQRADSNDLYIIGAVEVGNMVYSNAPQMVLIGDQQAEIKYPCWEASVELKDGNVLSLENGVIKEIKPKNKMATSKFITAKTDKGVEIKSDSEAFATGVEVYTEVEGKKNPLADGEYKLENGSTLVVAAGKISEVKEADDTEEAAAVAAVQSAVKPQFDEVRAEIKILKDAYEAKIKELETKLSNMPAQGKPKTEETKQPTKKQALAIHLGVLRKKDKELSLKK